MHRNNKLRGSHAKSNYSITIFILILKCILCRRFFSFALLPAKLNNKEKPVIANVKQRADSSNLVNIAVSVLFHLYNLFH